MEKKQKNRMTEGEMSVLFKTALFLDADDTDCRRAAARISAYTMRFEANEPIVEAGTHFSAIGVLAKGEATVIRSGERRRVIHKTITVGHIFGVSSLFDEDAIFPTTIKAVSDCTVIFLTERDVAYLLESFPVIAKNYIKLLTKKIRFLNHRLDSLAGRSAEERVADHLLSEIGGDGTIGITKSALASMLGLGRASLYRILDIFEKNGYIRTSRDRIEVLDATALKTFITNRKEQ